VITAGYCDNDNTPGGYVEALLNALEAAGTKEGEG